MNCEHSFSLINARMDGELPVEDRHRLTAHLGECADCRNAADEFEQGDRELAHLFAQRQESAARVAERVLEAWWNEAPSPSSSPSPSIVQGLWKLPLAVAAGFALAFLIMGPQWGGSNGNDPEARIRAMVSEWQQGDVTEVSELHLRALGSDSVPPLLDVVNNWAGDANASKRLAAARMIADLAGTSQIPAMIALLGDQSFEIQQLSDAALVRLTGWNRLESIQPELGPGPTGTQGASCSNPQAEWQEWWERNKDRFEQPDQNQHP
ncbi:MAG: anti-sigma factor family protein [Planctomycetota bacterium]|jgi:anti-sigma factor RsiW